MKSLFFLILGAIAIFATNSSAQTLTARQAIIQMQKGINIGNTLDASPNETSWGMPAIQEYYFQEYKRVGVQNVRIPITWGGHADQNYPYTVNAAFMDRVEQVVDWALKYNLYVIINMHHENWIKSDYNGQKQRFYAIWNQIIQRFKNKSQHLCFEILNEPTCGTGSLTQAQIDEVNKTVLAQVRTVNPTRLVLYGGTMWSNADRLYAAAIPDKNDQYLIGYYHAYDPFGMAHQCEYFTMTANDIQNMTKKYNDMGAWSKRNNIPVIIDEFGCKTCVGVDQRVAVLRLNRELAEKNGIAFSVWDDGGFEIYKRRTNTWHDLEREALFGTINKTINVTVTSDNNTICSAKTSILTATPTVTSGSVTKLEFYEGTSLLATDSVAPYIYTVSKPTIGNHYYYVQATHSSGEVAKSSSVLVTMTAGAAITPYIQVNGGAWAQQTAATVCAGGAFMTGPQPSTATGWLWKGPNGFTANTREVYLGNIKANQAGTYTATYDDGTGCPGTAQFVITVPSITPYIQVNGGTWAQQNTAGICLGGSFSASPQPSTNTGWSWTGPNGFTATTREITVTKITAAQAGTYTASYTDGSGCPLSSQYVISSVANPIPTVSSPVSYSQNQTAVALTATGTGLMWYNATTGGMGNAAAPVPSTLTVGTKSYFVSQTPLGCGESGRAQIDVVVKSVILTQNIQLSAGWNLISINLAPTDSSIATLFKGLDVQEIKTMDTYWRKGQPDAFNGLKTLSARNGYLVNMNFAGILSIAGTPVETGHALSLSNGWQLIGCPYQTATPFSQDYNATNCSAIKNFDGFWKPNGTANSLQNRETGKGYFLLK